MYPGTPDEEAPRRDYFALAVNRSGNCLTIATPSGSAIIAELSTALHGPGARLRRDRRRIPRRVLSGRRRGVAPGSRGRERSLARGAAIGVARAHRLRRRRDVRRLCLLARLGAARRRRAG